MYSFHLITLKEGVKKIVTKVATDSFEYVIHLMYISAIYSI